MRPNVTLNKTDVLFESRDGHPLHGTLYSVLDQKPKAVAIFATGIGISYLRYTRLFHYLHSHGVTILGFDYRGIGVNAYPSTRHLKNANPGAEEWCVRDLSAAVDYMLDRLSVDKLVGIGHSFGGTAFGFIDNPDAISSLIFVSSSSGYLGYYSGLDHLKKSLYMGLFVPAMVTLKGYLPARSYRGRFALPGKFALQWASWCFSPDYIKASQHGSSFSNLKVPLSTFAFHDDSIANEQATKALADLFDGCIVDTTFFSDGEYGHNAIFSSPRKEEVWTFLLKRISRTHTRDWLEPIL
jgi:predicted alpha/beta hydrolase